VCQDQGPDFTEYRRVTLTRAIMYARFSIFDITRAEARHLLQLTMICMVFRANWCIKGWVTHL
jgi:hypothetical protein